MREQFFKDLHDLMRRNWSVYFVTGDLGFGLADKIKQDYPERFFNVGAAEQAMMGVGIGLALEGKIPFVYSITPFLLFRPFEAIRNYVSHEEIPVIMVGSGRNRDYKHDGFSHWADDDLIITQYGIETIYEYESLSEIVSKKKPAYINLKR